METLSVEELEMKIPNSNLYFNGNIGKSGQDNKKA